MDLCEFQARLVYIQNSRAARATKRDPVFKRDVGEGKDRQQTDRQPRDLPDSDKDARSDRHKGVRGIANKEAKDSPR